MGGSGRWGRGRGLTGRRGECGVLDQLVSNVLAGGSGVLVVRGEPGVGKIALLDYLARRTQHSQSEAHGSRECDGVCVRDRRPVG